MSRHKHTEQVELDILDKQIIAAIQDGLPMISRPFAVIARQLDMTEQQVLKRLEQLKDSGTIKRLGVVVRHRELGFKANAMVVWDIPDERVPEVARKIASFECVTLCYQRPRSLPDWPFNLFSMIHGKNRDTVLQRLENLVEILELEDIHYHPLFSTRRFKQRGAHFMEADKALGQAEVDILPQSGKSAADNELEGFTQPASLYPVYG